MTDRADEWTRQAFNPAQLAGVLDYVMNTDGEAGAERGRETKTILIFGHDWYSKKAAEIPSCVSRFDESSSCCGAAQGTRNCKYMHTVKAR